MYLGSSKYWWAYLGIKSNPSIVPLLNDGFDRAVFFDDISLLPPGHDGPGLHRTKFFYILWDGLRDGGLIEKASLSLGRDADLTALIVGDVSRMSHVEYKFQSLYREGELSFNESPLRFDLRTAAILLGARIKTVLMPLKNIFQNEGRIFQGIKLLLGKKQVVFCGSFGTSPLLMKMCCERHSIDFSLFAKYEFYYNDPYPSLDNYRRYLRNDGLFLADLYNRSRINAAFFLSVVHLLGREYFIEKTRSAGVDIFVNGYTAGRNINVYTTPFYSQHLFIDFGSIVGTGNYPRLVDLNYFNKTIVKIELGGALDDLLVLASRGSLDTHFDREWALKAPQILRFMAISK
jgi:SAM-dependent methyltransferase